MLKLSIVVFLAVGPVLRVLADVPISESLLNPPPPVGARTNEMLEFKTKNNYHFNQKAPQVCGATRAHPLGEGKAQSLACQFMVAGEQRVSFKICDDQETFCRSEDFKIQVSGPNAVNNKGTAKAELPKVSGKADPAPIEGFLKNVPEEAIRQAKSRNVPLLIDFYGIWCPPCNVLEERVLSTKEFRNATKNFVRLSLDSDAEVSWPLKSQFHVRALPTLLIATVNSKGQLAEIGRRFEASLPIILAWLKKQQHYKNESIEVAEQELTLHPTTERRVRIAESLLNQKKNQEARALLKGLKSHEAEFLDQVAEIEMNQNADKTAQVAIYKKAIARFEGAGTDPAEPEILSWLESLAQLDKGAATPIAERVETWIERLKKSKYSTENGEDAGDFLEAAGSIFEVLEQTNLAKRYFSKAANFYAEQAKNSSRKVSRGLNQNRASCLLHADRSEEAEKIYQSLIKEFPGEYTFHFNYSRALFSLKKYAPAFEQIEIAEPLAYGDNWLRTMALKARILLAEKNKSEAIKMVDEALSRIILPRDPTLWIHRNYKDLMALRQEIEKSSQ